ncbi:MAG: type II secretion system F family protein [Phycisphaeraceae bacterium]|nr:type II secretion system F family protein [Phycisphaeraceae bacterium]
MKLAYNAVSATGTPVSDIIDATSMDEAMDVLRGKGLFVTQIEPESDARARKKVKASGGISFKSKTKQLKDVAMFSRQLNVLVATGTPLADGLAALERQVKDADFKAQLAVIREQVEQGLTLYDALGKAPRYFDEVYRNIIKAGEESGSLPVMLDRLALLTRKQVQVRSQIGGAMIYPCLLIFISIVVLAIMLTVVMPRFTGMFESLDVPLPATTVALMAMSDLLRTFWWAVLLCGIGGIIGLKFALATPAGKRFMDGLMLSVPVLREVTRSYATARIARLMGVLIECNVPLLDTIQLVRNATGNSKYETMMIQAEEIVITGEPVSGAFSDEKMIEPAFYEAVRNGEQSGRLSMLMITVADFMDEENDTRLRALTSLFEPLILVFLGLMVGGIAISMFMPMFDLTSMAGGG